VRLKTTLDFDFDFNFDFDFDFNFDFNFDFDFSPRKKIFFPKNIFLVYIIINKNVGKPLDKSYFWNPTC